MTAGRKTKQFQAALLNSEITPLLNKSALASSEKFLRLLEELIEKYRNDNNWDDLRKIALIFSGSKYFLAIVRFIGDYAGLEFRFKGKFGLHFSPIKERYPVPKYRDLSNYLTDPNLQKTLSELKEQTRKEKSSRKVGGDAMMRRLPGSFGSGK